LHAVDNRVFRHLQILVAEMSRLRALAEQNHFWDPQQPGPGVEHDHEDPEADQWAEGERRHCGLGGSAALRRLRDRCNSRPVQRRLPTAGGFVTNAVCADTDDDRVTGEAENPASEPSSTNTELRNGCKTSGWDRSAGGRSRRSLADATPISATYKIFWLMTD
jgi:hypothetical protein